MKIIVSAVLLIRLAALVILPLVCTSYVLLAQNPDPVLSPGSPGSSVGGGGGSGTVQGTEGAAGCFEDESTIGDCIAGNGIVISGGTVSINDAVIPTKAVSSGAPAMAGQLQGSFAVDDNASPERLYFCGADDGTDCTAPIRLASFSEITGGLSDPGSNGIVKRTALNTTDVAGYEDIIPLFDSGSCEGYLKSDGTCDTPAGGADPVTDYEFFEDFDTGNVTSGSVGKNNWTIGGGTTTRQVAESGVPGIIRRASGTSGGTNALLYTPSILNSGFLPAESFDMTWRIRLNVNDSNTVVRLGANCDNSLFSNNPPNNWIGFEKAAADTTWFGVTRSANGTPTRQDTTQSTSTSWVKLRIRRVDASTIGFQVNSTSEVTITATIPTTGCVYWTAVTNNNAAEDKTVDYDYVRSRIAGLTR